MAIETENDDVYSLRGYCNQELGLYEKALEDYGKAISIQPNDHKHFSNRGLLYIKLENFTNALSDYEKAIQLSPNENLKYINNRGWVKYKLNLLSEACVDFEYCATRGWEQAKSNYKKICTKE